MGCGIGEWQRWRLPRWTMHLQAAFSELGPKEAYGTKQWISPVRILIRNLMFEPRLPWMSLKATCWTFPVLPTLAPLISFWGAVLGLSSSVGTAGLAWTDMCARSDSRLSIKSAKKNTKYEIHHQIQLLIHESNVLGPRTHVPQDPGDDPEVQRRPLLSVCPANPVALLKTLWGMLTLSPHWQSLPDILHQKCAKMHKNRLYRKSVRLLCYFLCDEVQT